MDCIRSTTSLLDAENSVEMARLINQARLLSRCLGGPIPELSTEELFRVHDVLDVACGPGDWVLDVAYAHPHLEVAGVDSSPQVVAYASARARSQGLPNASFGVMDITQPLDFPDNTFDLVNARFLSSVLPREAWPALVGECVRVARPGGMIRLTDMELPICTTPAAQTMAQWFAQALFRAGYSFSPDGSTVGITPVLGHFLRRAGCESGEQRSYPIDFSSGTPFHHSVCQNGQVAATLLKSRYISLGVTTEEVFQRMFQRASIEVLSDDFCGLWPLFVTWAHKPR